MRSSLLSVTRRTQRTLKALSTSGLALILVLVLVAVVDTAMPMSVFAVGTVAPLDAWPATPQMTTTTGNLAGTYPISAGTNRLLVVLVCGYNSAFDSGQTFTATYGEKTLTQVVLQNSNERQTWIGYLKETDIASRSGDTLTVTVTGPHTMVAAYVASYSGVDQTTPVAAANGVYIFAQNDQTIGGPLTVNAGGYAIYGWSGVTTRTSDTETYSEHSDVDNPGTYNYGVASQASDTTGTTNPSVTWLASNHVSVSFVTLNPDNSKVTPTITWARPSDIVYGTTLSNTQFCATASVAGTFAYTPDFGALLLSGNSQTLHVQFTPADTSNYNSASRDVTINVSTATLTITANNRAKTFGDAAAFTGTEFTTMGLLASDKVDSVRLTTAGADASAAVGSYPIVPSAAVGTGLSNYTICYHAGSLTVDETKASPSVIFLSNASISGNSATLTATVTSAGATGTVTFKDGETILGSSTLSNGTATYTTSTLPAGSHSITAAYSGDANFAGSTSSAVDLTLKPAAGLSWGLVVGTLTTTFIGFFSLLMILRSTHKPTLQAQPALQLQPALQAQPIVQAQTPSKRKRTAGTKVQQTQTSSRRKRSGDANAQQAQSSRKAQPSSRRKRS